MSATNIEVLQDKHVGETIWVIASGASLDFISPDFFDDKTTIVVNEAFRDWPSTYVLMHHHASAQEAIDAGHRLVTTERDCGFKSWKKAAFRGDYYTYRCQDNAIEPRVNIDAIERGASNELVISACTVAEAIHFAAHLGASAVILCGVDGGMLDGRTNYKGYNEGYGTERRHLQMTQPLLMAVVQAIRQKGIPVYSLNPFIDFGLEGHRYESADVIQGAAWPSR